MVGSARIRLALSHAAVLALLVAALGAATYVVVGNRLQSDAEASVEAAARAELDRVVEAGRVTAPPDDDRPSASAVRVAVFLPHGPALGEGDEVPTWLRPQPEAFTTVRARGEDVRLVTLPVLLHGAPVATVVAGRSLAPEGRALHGLGLVLLLGGLAGVLASLVAGWWLAGRAVRPIVRAYEAQAGFAADASHELRTPLAFVRSGVEVLSERDPDLGGDVLREVEYLSSLTERLLTLARSGADRLAGGLRAVDLSEVCAAAARRIEHTAGTRLEVIVPADATVIADAVALEAALDAVFENVARHGGNRAEVRAAAREGRWRLSVADHGPGLPPEHLAHAFDRFFRADPSRSRDQGGAGLGLAIARSLIEAQHGRTWLDPTAGGGLTVWVELPAA
jgi:signal transduction histidine kinase